MKRARLSVPTRWRHFSTFPTAGVIGKQCLLLARREETTSSLIGADRTSPVFCQGTDLESPEARDEGRGR